MYSKKMEQLYLEVGKRYYKNWETFAMIGLRKMVKDLEESAYDKIEYTEYDIKIICKYICEYYFKLASKQREHLEEQRSKGE